MMITYVLLASLFLVHSFSFGMKVETFALPDSRHSGNTILCRDENALVKTRVLPSFVNSCELLRKSCCDTSVALIDTPFDSSDFAKAMGFLAFMDHSDHLIPGRFATLLLKKKFAEISNLYKCAKFLGYDDLEKIQWIKDKLDPTSLGMPVASEKTSILCRDGDHDIKCSVSDDLFLSCKTLVVHVANNVGVSQEPLPIDESVSYGSLRLLDEYHKQIEGFEGRSEFGRFACSSSLSKLLHDKSLDEIINLCKSASYLEYENEESIRHYLSERLLKMQVASIGERLGGLMPGVSNHMKAKMLGRYPRAIFWPIYKRSGDYSLKALRETPTQRPLADPVKGAQARELQRRLMRVPSEAELKAIEAELKAMPNEELYVCYTAMFRPKGTMNLLNLDLWESMSDVTKEIVQSQTGIKGIGRLRSDYGNDRLQLASSSCLKDCTLY